MFDDEPARGDFFSPSLLRFSGLEQLQRSIAGEFAPPPIHHLTGMRPTAVGEGTSEFVMPASGWLASYVGVVPGGMLAVLADGPLGCAIQTALPPATVYTTAELSISYLRPALPDGRLLTCAGRLIHAGRSLALSDAEVRDASGRQLAHATSRCFIFPPVPVPPAEPLPPVPVYDGPDPWQRPVQGSVADPDMLAQTSGLDQWRAACTGEMPRPPICRLTDLTVVDIDDGRAEMTMPTSRWLCSPTGFVEGGFIAFLADTALTAAAATLAPAGTAYASADLTVKFLRPVPPGTGDLRAVATVVHRGRTLGVATAEVRSSDGKLVAIATGSTMLAPGRSPRVTAVEDEPTVS